jgi:hypothetical protein
MRNGTNGILAKNAMAMCGMKMYSAWSTPNGLVSRLGGRLESNIIRLAHPQGRLPLVLSRRYRIREQCLRQIGDVVVVSEFKEFYRVWPKYSTESSVPSTLVRRLTDHFGSLRKNRLLTLERAAAADAAYAFAMVHRHQQMQSSSA